MAGKWHLAESAEYYPEQNGFDINIGGNNTGHPSKGYFSPYGNPQLKDGPEGEYLTDRLTDEVIRYISEPKEKPFLLSICPIIRFICLTGKSGKDSQIPEKAEPGGSCGFNLL